MYEYREVPRPPWDYDGRVAREALTRACASLLLNPDAITLRFALPEETVKGAALPETPRHYHPTPILGKTTREAGRLCVLLIVDPVQGMYGAKLAEVVAHEVRHCWQYLQGYDPDRHGGWCENDATIWGYQEMARWKDAALQRGEFWWEPPRVRSA